MKYYIVYYRTVKSEQYPNGCDVEFHTRSFYWKSMLREMQRIIKDGVRDNVRTTITDIRVEDTHESIDSIMDVVKMVQ